MPTPANDLEKGEGPLPHRAAVYIFPGPSLHSMDKDAPPHAVTIRWDAFKLQIQKKRDMNRAFSKASTKQKG